MTTQAVTMPRPLTTTEHAALDAARLKAFADLEGTLATFDRLTSIFDTLMEAAIPDWSGDQIVMSRRDAENINWMVAELSIRAHSAFKAYLSVGDAIRGGGPTDAS